MRFFCEISLICMHEDLFLHNVKSLIPLNHFHIIVYFLSGLCVYNVFILCVCVCVRAHPAFNRTQWQTSTVIF